jgi:predicted nucleic acid-binding protein
MVYVDTSALVPAFIREPKSEAVVAWIEASGDGLVVSEWSMAEFASAAAIKVQGILCLDETMGAGAKMIGLNVVSI